MMVRNVIAAAMLLLASAPALNSQSLVELPKAAEIGVSELPNGITCYLTECKEAGGYADFALVQRPAGDRQAEVRQSRHALVSLPHFGGRRPCGFLCLALCRGGEPGCIQASKRGRRCAGELSLGVYRCCTDGCGGGS